MKKNILLMEDDEDLGETIQELLESENYKVTLVKNGLEASEITYVQKFDIYVFDINVPLFDGISLLDSLRSAEDKTPAIFISAMVDLDTIKKAFKIGADDYIKKPFFPEELLIRINAKMSIENQIIYYKNISYNPDTKDLFIDNTPFRLSKMQFILFEIFIKSIDKPITKENIMELSGVVSESALRVAINKLKKTLSLDIENIHGLGYILEKS